FAAPANSPAGLGDFPPDTNTQTSLRGRDKLNVILFFTSSRQTLEKRLISVIDRLDPAGGLWICWPKKSSGVATDLTENVIRDFVLETGLVDNKVCAVDDTWSGLRFVVRVQYRTKS